MRLVACARAIALAAVLGFAATPASADDYQDAVDRAHAELEKFETWVAEQTAMLKEEIAELEEELDNSTAADKDRIDSLIEQADELADDLSDQADELSTATSERWDEVKASVLSGWHRTQAAYYAALAELRGSE